MQILLDFESREVIEVYASVTIIKFDLLIEQDT